MEEKEWMLKHSRQPSQGSFAAMWQKEMKQSVGGKANLRKKSDDTEGLGIIKKRCP